MLAAVSLPSSRFDCISFQSITCPGKSVTGGGLVSQAYRQPQASQLLASHASDSSEPSAVIGESPALPASSDICTSSPLCLNGPKVNRGMGFA